LKIIQNQQQQGQVQGQQQGQDQDPTSAVTASEKTV
jgi:hypothetical protein